MEATLITYNDDCNVVLDLGHKKVLLNGVYEALEYAKENHINIKHQKLV